MLVHRLHFPAADGDGRNNRNPCALKHLFQFFCPPVIVHDSRTLHDLRIQVLYRIGTSGGIDSEHSVHKTALYGQNGRKYLAETAGFKKPYDRIFCHFVCLHQA